MDTWYFVLLHNIINKSVLVRIFQRNITNRMYVYVYVCVLYKYVCVCVCVRVCIYEEGMAT